MRSKILEILKGNNTFISGEEISVKLGISRAAVWKHITALKKQGYEIQSVTNKGYRLIREKYDKISIEEIKRCLDAEFIGKKIFYYENIDSTNTAAKENYTEPDGTVFIAEHQEKGRGRLSRNWDSEPMSGIYMTILLKPEISPYAVSQITLVAGLAVTAAIEKLSREPVYIKWPNDVVIHGKKVCGILTELTAEENRINYAVVGIGINVNTKKFSDELKEKATSLFMENNKMFNRSELAATVLSEFEKYYTLFLKKGFSEILEDYSKKCITIGREVEVITPAVKYQAIAQGIDEEGRLLIKRNGRVEAINSGEVSVRGIYGYI